MYLIELNHIICPPKRKHMSKKKLSSNVHSSFSYWQKLLTTHTVEYIKPTLVLPNKQTPFSNKNSKFLIHPNVKRVSKALR